MQILIAAFVSTVSTITGYKHELQIAALVYHSAYFSVRLF